MVSLKPLLLLAALCLTLVSALDLPSLATLKALYHDPQVPPSPLPLIPPGGWLTPRLVLALKALGHCPPRL